MKTSRSCLLKGALCARLLLWSLMVVLTLGWKSASHAMPDFSAYHDQDEASHLQKVKTLSSQGFVPISLSVYGSTHAPVYAAVWVKRKGGPVLEFHGLSLKQLVEKEDGQALQNVQISVLSAVGIGDNARFSGFFQTGVKTLTQYGMDAAAFDAQNVQRKQQGFVLQSAFDYGPPAAPQFAAVYKRESGVLWNVGVNLSVGEAQQWYDAMAQQWARPAFSARNASGRYIALYRSDQVGPCVSRGELSPSAYQAEFDKQTAQGLFPICVQASGQGGQVRFAAIFAQTDLPLSRKFTITGPSSPELNAFDVTVAALMKASGTRSGSVAVTRNGKLVMAHGYTWAEPTYPLTQPTSLFRIASCSKPLTSIAVHQLIEAKKLDLNDGVQDVLHLKPPAGQTMDERFKDVKVWHLLSHAGGRFHGPDVPSDFAVADTFKKSLPVSKQDVASYMMGQPLDYAPGSVPWSPEGKDYYSNFGFGLLGQIIEAKYGGGQSYETLMKQHVWKPLGVTRARIARPAAKDAAKGEVHYYDSDANGMDLRLRPTTLENDGHLVPLPYGGENLQNFDSFGGWVVAAPDYAKVLASFDLKDNPLFADQKTISTMWSPPSDYAATNPNLLRGWFLNWRKGGKVLEYTHGGALPGVATSISHRSDGISIVAFFNGAIGDVGGQLGARADQVLPDDWPSQDLFSQMNIPAFGTVNLNLGVIKMIPMPPNLNRLPAPTRPGAGSDSNEKADPVRIPIRRPLGPRFPVRPR